MGGGNKKAEQPPGTRGTGRSLENYVRALLHRHWTTIGYKSFSRRVVCPELR